MVPILNQIELPLCFENNCSILQEVWPNVDQQNHRVKTQMLSILRKMLFLDTYFSNLTDTSLASS